MFFELTVFEREFTVSGALLKPILRFTHTHNQTGQYFLFSFSVTDPHGIAWVHRSRENRDRNQ